MYILNCAESCDQDIRSTVLAQSEEFEPLQVQMVQDARRKAIGLLEANNKQSLRKADFASIIDLSDLDENLRFEDRETSIAVHYFGTHKTYQYDIINLENVPVKQTQE